MMEGALIIDAPGVADAVGHAPVQPRQSPFWKGDANYRYGESPALRHGVEGGEDHFVGEVAGHSEENQRV
jgi:hypothetical protein